MFTCSKLYSDIPFAHRQHSHDGHCALIHGHNWGFRFTFGCSSLDKNGFVVDFGDLKWLKEWLNETFDHCLVLNENDPALNYLKGGLCDPVGADEVKHFFPFAKITVVPNCGAEGLAKWLHRQITSKLAHFTDCRVFIVSVEVLEDSKNSAIYSK